MSENPVESEPEVIGSRDHDPDDRYNQGKRAAMIAVKVDGEVIEEKPYGQTSEDVYPYTYWWVKGWNDAVAELAEK